MDQRLAILARHHRRILEVLTAARPLLTSARQEADLPGISYVRHEMIELLANYRRFVHEDVHAKAAAGSPEARDDAAALRDVATDIDDAYDAFRARWAERAVADNWSEYRLSAIRLMKQITDSVNQAASLGTNWARESRSEFA